MSLSSTVLVAQSSQAIKQVNVAIGSPEAAEMAKYGNMDVSLFKGVPNVTVPIHEFSLKDFSMPVYLSYDAGGIKVDQIATNVGLGWSLHAGGQISQVVHGLNDIDWPRESLVQNPTELQGFDPNIWVDGSSTGYDDYYFAYSMFDPDGPTHMNIKPDVFVYSYGGTHGKFIKEGGQTYHSVPYQNHSVSYNDSNHSFEIVDENGNLFVFDKRETTFNQKDLQNCWGGPGGLDEMEPIQINVDLELVYTWHLGKIVTANQDTLLFHYDTRSSFTYPERVIQQKYRQVQYTGGCPQTIPDYHCVLDKTVAPLVLNKVEWIRNGAAVEQVEFVYNQPRDDFGNSSYKSLDEIEVKKQGESWSSFSLDYGYFTSSVSSDQRHKRLKLNQVQQAGFPAYQFDYEESITMPHRGSFAQDHWGYYNGHNSNQSMVPHFTGSSGTGNRNVVENKIPAWSLNKITWPTGGSTILNTEGYSGGLRVESMYDLNGLNDTTGTRHFDYNIHQWGFHHYVDEYDIYLYDDPIDYPSCRYQMYTSSSVTPSYALDAPEAGFSNVTIMHGQNGINGKTEVEYSTGWSGMLSAAKWGSGEKIREIHYDANDNPLMEQVITFKEHYSHPSLWASATHPHEEFLYGLDIKLKRAPMNSPFGFGSKPARFNVEKFRIVSAWYHPDSTTTYMYDPNDSNLFTKSVTKTEYNTTTARLDAMIEVNSDDTQRRTEFTYGVPGKPSKLTSVSVENNSSYVIQKRWAIWSNSLGSGRHELHKIWDWNSESGTPGSSPNVSTDLKIQEVSNYDTYGNPLKLFDTNGNEINYTYDSNGVLLTDIDQINPGGTDLAVQADYNNLGLLETIWNNGRKSSYRYDNLHRLDSLLNNTNDLISEFDYTVVGNNLSTSNMNRIQAKNYTDVNDVRESMSYFDGLGRLVQSQQQGSGHAIVSALEYDNRGREWKSYKSYPVSGSISYQSGYEAGAQAEYGTYPFLEQLYEASPLNRPVQTIPEGGLSISGSVDMNYEVRSWNSSNWLVNTTSDEEGNLTETWSDGWGRTIRTIADPNGLNIETRFVYDELDRLQTVYHPNHFSESGDWKSEYEYNPRGDLVKRMTQDSGTTEYKYDAAGNLRFSQDANQVGNNIASYTTYDFAGRPLVEGVGDIGIKAFTDLDTDTGENFEAVDENKRGVYAWDSKPSASTYPWSEFATLINNTTISNTIGNLTARAWRFGGEEGVPGSASLIGTGITGDETYLAATTITAENTVVNTGASLTLNAGETITLKPGFHAETGSILQASIDGLLASQGSDGISTVAGENPWQVELFSYDDEGRVSDKWIWTGDKREWDTHLAYEYNWLGEVTRMKVQVGDPAVNTETLYQHYEYNQLGQLTSVYISTTGTQPSTPEVTYTYIPSGAIDKILYEGGKQAEYEYTIRDWVESINDIDSPGGSFAAFYDYENNGNISMSRFYNPDIDISSTHRDYRYAYTYDELNRLTEANYSFGTSGSSSSWFDVNNLSYDANGNIRSLTRNDDSGTTIDNLTYNYGSNNRLDSLRDAATEHPGWDAFSSDFGYDDNGNMISQSGKFTNIAYEHRNLPIHFYLDNNEELIANYNSEGQRILKESSGGGWSFYVTDGPQTLAVIDQDGLSHMNLFGTDQFGRLEASSGAISTANTRRYYLKDHLGSTRAVVGQDGFLKETHDFYPFGLTMPGRSKGEAITREQFTGQLRDNEPGFNLDYFKARYYDSAMGRFLSMDPLSDEFPGWTPYHYVGNDPINYADPTGLYRVHRAAYNANGVISRVTRLNLNTLFRNELNGTIGGMMPFVGSAVTGVKMAMMGMTNDNAWQAGFWDYAGLLSGGLAALPKRAKELAGAGINVGSLTSKSLDRFITPEAGRDQVMFNVATQFGGGGLFEYESGNSHSIILNQGFATALKNSHEGLDAVDNFTKAFMNGASGVVTGIAKSQGFDLTSQQGRNDALNYYKSNKDKYDQIIQKEFDLINNSQ